MLSMILGIVGGWIFLSFAAALAVGSLLRASNEMEVPEAQEPAVAETVAHHV